MRVNTVIKSGESHEGNNWGVTEISHSQLQGTRRTGSRGAKPLAEFLAEAIEQAAKRQGFGQAGLLLYWEEVVGERLAGMAEPIKIVWPPRQWSAEAKARTAPATLILQVESAFALEIQHLAPLILERVNVHFGWACVGRILLKQGPLTARRARRPSVPKPDPKVQKAASQRLDGFSDERLRQALTRLGSHALGSN